MKRNDDVFMFTLVDLLVQVLFFGLFLFVAGEALHNLVTSTDKAVIKKLSKEVGDVQNAAGVSSITELTDFLSNLGPNKIGAVGNIDGGPEKLKKALAAIFGQAGGQGKAPCLAPLPDGKTHYLATIVAEDERVSFTDDTAELREVLSRLGLEFEDVKDLSLREFTAKFSRVSVLSPNCAYTVKFVEHTRFVDARDAVGQVFYTSIVR